jgi:hypothetical protein
LCSDWEILSGQSDVGIGTSNQLEFFYRELPMFFDGLTLLGYVPAFTFVQPIS